MKQRIEELRQAIRQCEMDHGEEREGVEQLKRELEKFTITLQGKVRECGDGLDSLLLGPALPLCLDSLLLGLTLPLCLDFP